MAHLERPRRPGRKGCEYCGDKVLILRRVDCENCTESQDGEMCGKLKRCPDEGDYCYECVCDDEHIFCPMCGKRLEVKQMEGEQN